MPRFALGIRHPSDFANSGDAGTSAPVREPRLRTNHARTGRESRRCALPSDPEPCGRGRARASASALPRESRVCQNNGFMRFEILLAFWPFRLVWLLDVELSEAFREKKGGVFAPARARRAASRRRRSRSRRAAVDRRGRARRALLARHVHANAHIVGGGLKRTRPHLVSKK